jgi:CRP-like cAMP-binding protein
LCRDEVLFKQNDLVDGVYIIKEGEVQYYKALDNFHPELVGTKSWCRADLLSQTNEKAKK